VSTTRQQARTAGILYLVMALIAPIGLLYVPAKLIVSGDPAGTAANVRAAEGLLRAGIVTELVHQTIAIFLVLALYRLFKEVNVVRARQMVVLGALVSVPIAFVNVLNELAALALTSNHEYLSAWSRPQRDAMAYLFLDLHKQGITVVSIFWGLWLFPFGSLVIRCGFIPRIFGILLMIAGAAYLAVSFTTLLLPERAAAVSRFAGPLAVAELPVIFWLVIRGARPVAPAQPARF
jgi:Domain of unknown function (DUF4386)